MANWKWQEVIDAGSGIRVYRLTGILTDSRDVDTLIERVRAETRSYPYPLLVNLSDVEHLTSAGVAMLTALYTSALNAKVGLAICGPSAKTRAILDIFRLRQRILAFGDEQEALAAYASGGWGRVT